MYGNQGNFQNYGGGFYQNQGMMNHNYFGMNQ
jgi:hypothetical protein